MKKKTIANAVMVAVITLIVISGVLIAGNILGWFDEADPETAMLTDIRGIVRMNRDGVSYTVEEDIVLRPGDTLICEQGASAKICVGEGYLTMGESAEITVSDPTASAFSAKLTTGELFANCVSPATVSFDGKSVQFQNATAHLSVRTGAQSISVFSGSVGQAKAGELLEYINGDESVRPLQINGLNDFTISQIRSANQTQTMYFTDAQLDELVAQRNDALQDIINSQLPSDSTTHTHAYDASIIAPTCTQGGYTEYICTCGERYTDSETAATGHIWAAWITQKEPTASAEGLEKRTCSVCNFSEERTFEKLSEGHSHSYADTVVSATCTTGGYILHNCTCGASFTDGETKALGHSWSAWETVKNPTTSLTGLKKRTCSVCKTSEEKILPRLEVVEAGYVYLTIRCDTILDNWDELNPAKAEFVPADGVILPRMKVAFAEGETVFDVLVRVCAAAEIQLEYSWEPLYDAYYIEGINNLYQFDCSSESGWMYKVNEWFPNYGVSAYTVKDGDVIDFLYTCHGYGTDVGAPEWEE